MPVPIGPSIRPSAPALRQLNYPNKGGRGLHELKHSEVPFFAEIKLGIRNLKFSTECEEQRRVALMASGGESMVAGCCGKGIQRHIGVPCIIKNMLNL